MEEDPEGMMPEPEGFIAFRGEGNRLDGKKKKLTSESESEPQASHSRQVSKFYVYSIKASKNSINGRLTGIENPMHIISIKKQTNQ